MLAYVNRRKDELRDTFEDDYGSRNTSVLMRTNTASENAAALGSTHTVLSFTELE